MCYACGRRLSVPGAGRMGGDGNRGTTVRLLGGEAAGESEGTREESHVPPNKKEDVVFSSERRLRKRPGYFVILSTTLECIALLPFIASLSRTKLHILYTINHGHSHYLEDP